MRFDRRAAIGFLFVPAMAAIAFAVLSMRIGSIRASFEYLAGNNFALSAPKFVAIDPTNERIKYTLTNLSNHAWKVELVKCSCTCTTHSVDAGAEIKPWKPREISFEVDRSNPQVEPGVCAIFFSTAAGMSSIEFQLRRE